MPGRDLLFLLKPAFGDPRAGSGTYYCPECLQVEGLLASFPFLRDTLEVHYVDFPRPRPALVELVGEANQSCPVLVAASGAPADGLTPTPTGRFIAAGAAAISAWLGRRHGTPVAHP